MTDPTPTPPRPSSRTGPTWLTLAGFGICLVAFFGTVMVLSDLGSGFDGEASDATKWLAVLAGLTAFGTGTMTIALGQVLSRMDERRS